jgi:hypothetical protein
LEEYKKGKYYLHAAELLERSVKSLFDDDLLEIQALADLRKDLVEHRNVRLFKFEPSFTDISRDTHRRTQQIHLRQRKASRGA